MKNNNLARMLSVLILIISISISCKKGDEIGPDDKNSLVINFDNRVGDMDLTLKTANYKNSSGEDFTITTFNYFISNIAVKKIDGTVVKFPNDYFLIKESDPNSQEIELTDLAAGDYSELSFMVGVDSSKSVSDISKRTGVLDPSSYGDDNMYWSWNSGYIFSKIEGISSVVPENSAGIRKFEYHVGGFGGRTAATPNNLKTITVQLPDNATVRKDIAPEIHLFTNVAKVFSGSTNLKLANINNVHSIGAAVDIANNISKMFSIDHIHNEKQ